MDDGAPGSDEVGGLPSTGRRESNDAHWIYRLLQYTPIILGPEPDRWVFRLSLDGLPPNVQRAHARSVANYWLGKWFILIPWSTFGSAFVIWVLLRLHIYPSWPGLVIVIGPMVFGVIQIWRWNRRTGSKGVAWRQRYVDRALSNSVRHPDGPDRSAR
jgi:hypothetical protein